MAVTYDAQDIGFLAQTARRILAYANEPAERPKWNGLELWELVTDAYSRVMEDINASGANPIVVRFAFSTVADQARYWLPGNVGQVLMIGTPSEMDTAPLYVDGVAPRSRWSPGGQRVALEGQSLFFDPAPTEAEDLAVIYIPSGYCPLHLGTFDSSSAGSTSFTLDSAPEEGYFDRTPNAYVGAVVRVLESAGGWKPGGYLTFPIQERIITSIVGTSLVATVDPSFDFDFGDEPLGECYYEVLPMFAPELQAAIVWDAVASIHATQQTKDGIAKEARALRRRNMELAKARTHFSTYNMRSGSKFDSQGPARYGRTGYGVWW